MPSTLLRQEVLAKATKIVVKVGTNAITGADGRLDHAVVRDLAAQTAAIMAGGASVTLVASGAVGAGMAELDLAQRPRSLPMLQATAAVGQGQLMRTFHDAFARHNIKVAQVLLTRDLFESRARYLCARNALAALAGKGVLPIINENDVVAVDELKFGDNDIIAALVANMLGADLLVLLSVVDGVMKDGRAIEMIESVDESALSVATGERSRLGSGGMASKMSAAGMVTGAGAAAVIANARTPGILPRLLAGEKLGTVFAPAKRRMSSRRRWIAQASRTAGRIVVDDGAARALREQGRSLLPSGIRAVSGHFKRGAAVAIIDPYGRQIARGLVNYSAEQIDAIRGLKTTQIAKALGQKPCDEVVHRNNMTLG
ncbi:MAG: glutamate 5-kinase [Phycisphaerae bacterium]